MPIVWGPGVAQSVGPDPALEGDPERSDAAILARRAFEPDAPDEVGQCLAGDGGKDAMKMEGRERRDRGQPVEREILGEVGLHVAHDPVDPPLVLAAMRGARPTGLCVAAPAWLHRAPPAVM